MAQERRQTANAELNVKRDMYRSGSSRDSPEPDGCDTQSYVVQRQELRPPRRRIEQDELKLGLHESHLASDGKCGINTEQVGNLVGPSTVLTAVSQVSPHQSLFPDQRTGIPAQGMGRWSGERGLYHARSRIPLQLTLADRSTTRIPAEYLSGRQVNKQTENQSNRWRVPNSKNLLRPAINARIQAPTGNITGAMLVPQAAVNQQQEPLK